jgi:beta-phosphoglucomutase-like phosphatase (HAD superfamily)
LKALPLRAVIFDVDGTLVDFYFAWGPTPTR